MKTIIRFLVVSGFLVVSFYLFSPGMDLANVDEVATNEGGSIEVIECGPMDEATAPLQVALGNPCLASDDGSCVNEGASCNRRKKTRGSPSCRTQILPTGDMICHCIATGRKK